MHFKRLPHLLSAVLLLLAGQALAQFSTPLPRVSGTITTQNLVPGGTATPGSCVAIDATNAGSAQVGVEGTYTGALSGQITVNDTTWKTLAPTPFTPATAQTSPVATISSGSTGIWQVGLSGASGFRVCALAAVTGTATVTIRPTAAASPGGASSGGGGGAVTVADGASVALGATTNSPCATDTGNCAVVDLLKRLNTNVNTVDAVASTTASNVSASTSSGTCIAANAARKGAVIVNDSATATEYVKLGATASATSYTFQLAPGATLTLPNFPTYTGIIDCIWTVASGAARITEY